MPIKSTNTFAEGITALAQSCAALKLLPDAIPELGWITDLETQILQKVHQAQGAQYGATPPPMMAPPQGPPPMPPPGMPGGIPADGPPGVMSNAPMPNPDELRRILAGAG